MPASLDVGARQDKQLRNERMRRAILQTLCNGDGGVRWTKVVFRRHGSETSATLPPSADRLLHPGGRG